MEKILLKIGEFSGVLGNFRDEITKIIKEINGMQEKQALNTIAQDTRSKDLDNREAEIKKIEDVIKLKKDTEDLLNQLASGSQALQKKEQAFKDEVAKHSAKVIEDKAENDKSRNANIAESNALIKARAELDEDKKTYKEKLLKELLAKVK